MPELQIPRVAASSPTGSGKSSRIALVRIDALPPGQGRCFPLGQIKVAVFRERDGRISAIDAVCPHRGGPLADGLAGDGMVICPLHAHRFRLSDGAGVDTDFCVQAYPVEIEDGWVLLEPRRG